ncbi:MAG: hypothetical protein L0G10_13515 [Acinetobacter sp.]|nr:hypothetical protein [Acinetobacter sp.]
MKRLLLIGTLLFSGLANAEAPFGLKTGMSLAEVIKVSGVAEVLDKNYYSFKNVPKPYKAFKDYLMLITPQNGLCKVLGWGKPITTNVYGDGIKDEFASLKESLTEKYGTPVGDYNFLRSGSIWKEPNDWTMGLYKEERTLVAAWEPNEENGVKNIMLKARANGPNSGQVTLSYELSNSPSCFKEKGDKDTSGL